MESILVTGGAGHIGSHIVEQLIQMKKRVLIVDNLSTGYKKLIHKSKLSFVCDIKNYKNVNYIFKQNQISTVIHLAAKSECRRKPKNQEKYYSNNVYGTKNIVECCKQKQH